MTPTRRAVLVSALIAGVASASGCTGTRPPRPLPADPDVALREAAVARETDLLAAYDAVAAAVPTLAARLRPLRGEHEEHLRALQAGAPPSAASRPEAAPSTASRPAAGTPAPAVAVRDLTGLVRAERTAAAAHARAATVASRPLAAVLASLAASEASHLVALG